MMTYCPVGFVVVNGDPEVLMKALRIVAYMRDQEQVLLSTSIGEELNEIYG